MNDVTEQTKQGQRLQRGETCISCHKYIEYVGQDSGVINKQNNICSAAVRICHINSRVLPYPYIKVPLHIRVCKVSPYISVPRVPPYIRAPRVPLYFSHCPQSAPIH